MRNIEKYNDLSGKFDLDDLLDEVLDGVNHDLLYEDEEDNVHSDYCVLNPGLLDLNSDEHGNPSEPSTAPVASRFVENESMCSLLNEGQKTIQFYNEMFSGVTIEQKE